MERDEEFMTQALALAKEAAEEDEVPVGCVIVQNGEVIATGRNRRETAKNALAHAEIEAISGACAALRGWRLIGCTMYVTLEPCPMCAGAIVNARLPRVVYGAKDPRFGAMGSLFDVGEIPLNHKADVTAGVLGEECSLILSDFFKKKRKPKAE